MRFGNPAGTPRKTTREADMPESRQDQAGHEGLTDRLRRRLVGVIHNRWFQAMGMAAASAAVTSLTTKFVSLL
ncbi:hypothetical protein [Streptomyces prunicolor]|uniref:hypothetical protein n=1 Tax=Streptomyces prunicolor TaxID=67348 RepID=UPI001319BB07|nr:hypothetical protein [Streptomyces prunicolor]